MEPVRIRLYGLVSMTKRGYLMQLAAAGVLLAALLVIRASMPALPQGTPQDPLPPRMAWVVFLLRNLHWLAVLLAVLFTVEAFLVLRAFARAENRPLTPGPSPTQGRGE